MEQNQTTNNSNIIKLNRFQIKQEWIGEGRIIQVKFERGIYTHLKYQYHHDFVVKACDQYLQEHAAQAWNNLGIYMNGRNIPGWAKDYVQILKP